jgi:hypothetical protein
MWWVWVFAGFLVLFRVGCEVLVGLCVSEVPGRKGWYMDIQGVKCVAA